MNFKPELFEVGSRVHDTVSIYYKQFYKPKITLPKLQTILYNILRRDWDYTLPAEDLAKAKRCLDNFATFEVVEMVRRNYEKPYSELVVYDNDLVGIIDYYHPETGKVIDFKTSNSTYLGKDYKVQASVYLYLLNQTHKKKLDKFYFYFLPSNTLVEVEFSQSLLEEVKNYVSKLRLSIEKGEFPKTESRCQNCSYRFYCKVLER